MEALGLIINPTNRPRRSSRRLNYALHSPFKKAGARLISCRKFSLVSCHVCDAIAKDSIWCTVPTAPSHMSSAMIEGLWKGLARICVKEPTAASTLDWQTAPAAVTPHHAHAGPRVFRLLLIHDWAWRWIWYRSTFFPAQDYSYNKLLSSIVLLGSCKAVPWERLFLLFLPSQRWPSVTFWSSPYLLLLSRWHGNLLQQMAAPPILTWLLHRGNTKPTAPRSGRDWLWASSGTQLAGWTNHTDASRKKCKRPTNSWKKCSAPLATREMQIRTVEIPSQLSLHGGHRENKQYMLVRMREKKELLYSKYWQGCKVVQTPQKPI